MTLSNILLAAGGTGGHVFPAVATAQELTKRGYKVYFATDKRGEKYLKNIGFEYRVISSASPGGNVFKRGTALLKLLWGMMQSNFYFAKIKPKLVIGFGGYPSFPPMIAARFNFIKTILHEQNSHLGKANRFLSRHATVTAISFPKTQAAPSTAKLVGNPVRAEIVETPYPAFGGKINLLVTGGSQGAKLFSDSLPGALAGFADKITITQQVREEDIDKVREIYSKAGVEFELKSFFDDMPKRLSFAHLVICRAGASTIFELARSGRPAVFVPLAVSAGNHQFYNANAVVESGGGWIIEEKDFNAENLNRILAGLLSNPARLAEAAEKVKQFSHTDAAAELADLAEEMLK